MAAWRRTAGGQAAGGLAAGGWRLAVDGWRLVAWPVAAAGGRLVEGGVADSGGEEQDSTERSHDGRRDSEQRPKELHAPGCKSRRAQGMVDSLENSCISVVRELSKCALGQSGIRSSVRYEPMENGQG